VLLIGEEPSPVGCVVLGKSPVNKATSKLSGCGEAKGSDWAAQNCGAKLGRALKMPRTLLIDTDTASDDAVALIMALRSSEVRVAAITVVAGNIPVAQATSNALFTVELCGADVPVYSGAETPLLRKLEIADWFHGADGLGDHGYKPAKRRADQGHAVDALIQTVRDNPGIEIVTLGPLTNVAMALLREPKLSASVRRCVVMGGAPCCVGNVTPAAEFNIWVDPEAARIVFQSGLPLEMVGWQLCCGEAVLNQEDIDRVLALKNPIADFAIRCNGTAARAFFKQTGQRGISLPDPVAMGIALNSALCTSSSKHFVQIEVSSELTRGMTVVDRLNVATDSRNENVWVNAIERDRKVDVCWALDTPKWKDLLFSSLA
jgi:purine nucleosidase